MKVSFVIVSFLTAVLGLLNGTLRLVKLNGDGWEIVWGIGWLIFGAVWLWNAILTLKIYKKLKNETEDEGETNG